MAEHVFGKSDLSKLFDSICNRQLGEIATDGYFENVKNMKRQKGVVGTLIEQCVLKYPADTRQEPDLVVVDCNVRTPTELKVTGMRIVGDGDNRHYIAKESMSITAASIFDLPNEIFEESHFWSKLEHLLLVYYHYDSDEPVEPYDYRLFYVRGYEFHEFLDAEKKVFKADWICVRDFLKNLMAKHPGDHSDKFWRSHFREVYCREHGWLHGKLNYIDLAPAYPPRFRVKKPMVSAMIAQHFGNRLEQLPETYTAVNDIMRKCRELTWKYAGRTIRELSEMFQLDYGEKPPKNIAELMIIAMFGGTSKSLGKIDAFARLGIIGKSITLTARGGRTEDMKFFQVNFAEVTRREVIDENDGLRPIAFEDSDFYSYFADHEILCIVFKESARQSASDKISMFDNVFVGFYRLVFNGAFISKNVKALWDDTREKIFNHTLADVVRMNGGKPVRVKSDGSVSSSPNFMKSSQNLVFFRGGAANSSKANKTECVNGIKMLPQYVWMKGSELVKILEGNVADSCSAEQICLNEEVFGNLEQASSETLYRLGVCRYNGYGIKVDATEAVRLWHKSASLGNAKSKKILQTLGIAIPSCF